MQKLDLAGAEGCVLHAGPAEASLNYSVFIWLRFGVTVETFKPLLYSLPEKRGLAGSPCGSEVLSFQVLIPPFLHLYSSRL